MRLGICVKWDCVVRIRGSQEEGGVWEIVGYEI